MGDVLKFPSSLIENHDFLVDMARYSESSLTEKQIRKKYHFDDTTWEKMGSDDSLVEAIEAEKIRRIRDGSAKRELAQKHIVRGPDILNDIMSDPAANNRHRVDAVKALDALATPPAQAAPEDRDRFIIQINLGTDADGKEIVQRFNKSRTINVDDPNDPDNVSTRPQELIAIVTTKQNKDDGGGNHI